MLETISQMRRFFLLKKQNFWQFCKKMACIKKRTTALYVKPSGQSKINSAKHAAQGSPASMAAMHSAYHVATMLSAYHGDRYAVYRPWWLIVCEPWWHAFCQQCGDVRICQSLRHAV
jgi:hypothetical protein